MAEIKSAARPLYASSQLKLAKVLRHTCVCCSSALVSDAVESVTFEPVQAARKLPIAAGVSELLHLQLCLAVCPTAASLLQGCMFLCNSERMVWSVCIATHCN